MELLSSSSSPSATSDDSSIDDSTDPVTPGSSPMFGAARTEALIETPLSHLLSIPKKQLEASELSTEGLCYPQPVSLRELSFGRPIRHIAVVGAGYVGGPTAAVIALHNPQIRVEVLDKDQRRVRCWNSPHLPIHEAGLIDIVRVTRDGAKCSARDNAVALTDRPPNLFFTTDFQASLARADVVFVAVNTPTKMFGIGAGRATNMTSFDLAVKETALYARSGTIIVEKSTVPCGTAHRVRQILEAVRPGQLFEVLSNPEFLSEGSAVHNLLHPDRVLIGSAKTYSGHRAAEALAGVYAAWVPRSRILEVNAWSSELAKLVSNAMLAQRISSINSISAICDRTGADVDEIARSAGLDPRIGPQFLRAGLGFGGSCFRKDIASLTYLAESLGLPEVAHYWSQVNIMNNWQRDRFAYKVIHRMEENLVDKKIAILGFAFKKNTGDTRESLAVDVIRTLFQEEPGEIAIFDPCCVPEDIMRELEPVLAASNRGRISIYTDAYQTCDQANAVVIINDSEIFKQVLTKKQGSLNGNSATKERMLGTNGASTPIYIDGARFSYMPMQSPNCAEDCPDCQSTMPRRNILTEPVEWRRISYGMKEPKWVFDGRGVLDVTEMEKLGFRVETLGRETTSRIYNYY